MNEPDTTKPDESAGIESEPGATGAEGGFDSATGQLELGDADTSLPWLEGDDEDEGDYAGYNTGQLVAFVVLGLLVLGLVVGGIWWVSRGSTDRELVADGGVIKAPQTPYKAKPANPGGKTFEGTGDTSFAVSEGKTRPAKLGTEPPSPSPGFASLDDKKKPATPSASEQKPAAASSEPHGVGVQVAAYSNTAQAESGWRKLEQQYDLLSGLKHRVVEGQADIGTVYRLQAVTDDLASAKTLCRKLRAAGQNCQVKN